MVDMSSIYCCDDNSTYCYTKLTCCDDQNDCTISYPAKSYFGVVLSMKGMACKDKSTEGNGL